MSGPAESLDAILREHKRLRELGVRDPNAWQHEPVANEDGPRKPSRFRRVLATLGGLWFVTYPFACFALLWDWHHPWTGEHPILGLVAVVCVIGPLVLVGCLLGRAYAR
jgi:hypothetical protein